ncbi:MAG: PIN domain-containing protein [Bacteroidia bacterium]
MKYLLDTNIIVHFFRGKFNLNAQFQEVGLKSCAISEITLAELIYGAEHSLNPEKNFALIESFSNEITILPIINAVYLYGKEKSRLRKNGIMISDFDLLIGTTAVAADLIMVTENVLEFERIHGIRIENWIKR